MSKIRLSFGIFALGLFLMGFHFRLAPSVRDNMVRTVVIDAGHGGKDPGCSGPNSVEKHLALNIAKKFGALLEANYPEVEVIYTRKKDVFVELYKRADIANKAEADLFVSIHCNALPANTGVRGSETYVMSPTSLSENLEVSKRENEVITLEEDHQERYDDNLSFIWINLAQTASFEHSILFANHVQDQMMLQEGIKSRGVKQGNFVVLRRTTMPSVLVETGYMTNKTDAELLESNEGQDKIALAMLYAFGNYKAEMEGTQPSQPIVLAAPSETPVALPVTQKTEVVAVPQETTVPKSTTVTPEPAPTVVEPLVMSPERTAAAPKESPQPAKNEATLAQNKSETPRAIQNDVVQKSLIKNVPSGSTFAEIQTEPTVLTGTAKPKTVQYFVQVSASPKPVTLDDAPLRELGYQLEVVLEDEYYKYQVSVGSTYDSAVAAQQKLRSKGFKGAFVKAYHDQTPLAISEAKGLEQ